VGGDADVEVDANPSVDANPNAIADANDGTDARMVELDGPSISTRFFAQNAWMPAWVGDDERFGDLEELLCGLAYVEDDAPCTPGFLASSRSGIRLMRYGGIAVDEHYVAGLSEQQYVDKVHELRANGFEPLLQVPVADGDFGVDEAVALVTRVNVTERLGVRFWTIGNEPNKEYVADAAEIAGYFRPISRAMKDVDPDILIAGPDLTHYDSTIMTALTEPGGPSDIAGVYTADDGSVRTYLDVLDFHTYPFHGNRERSEVMAEAEGDFQANLVRLAGRAKKAEPARIAAGRAPLELAVTEININWQNPDDMSVDGEGPKSFLNGQFWAELMNVSMRHGLAFIAFWSIKEGNEYGMVQNDGTLGSTFHHYQLIATHFGGTYLATAVSGDPEVKAFASRKGNRTAVMVLGQQQGGDGLGYSVRLDGGAVQTASPIEITLDAAIDAEYVSPEALAPESTVLLLFDAKGRLLSRTVYSIEDARTGGSPHAYAN
jgi:hypothetical protein